MTKKWIFLLFLLAGVPLLQAQDEPQVLGTYQARLSRHDHFNSDGSRLQSPAAIIRQDRANFHKFHDADPEDEGDEYFGSADHRALMEQALEHGHTSPAVYREIVNGTPLIKVTIFRFRGGIYLDVKIVD